MTTRSDRPAPNRAPPTLRSLVDRIAAAELDPVQLASMDLHLSHLLWVRRDWASSKTVCAAAAPDIALADQRAAATG